MRTEEYQPAWVEFDIAEDEAPLSLGEFETLEEASKYIHENAVAVPVSLTVNRHMDNYEKSQIRDDYQEVLENTLPHLEREQAAAFNRLNEAKRDERDATGRVNAAIIEAKILAKEVRKGIKEIRLDEHATFRIPFNGRYFFYTYIDKNIKLCAVRDMPEKEKSELWNKGVDNSKLFTDEQIETQEGQAEQLPEVVE